MPLLAAMALLAGPVGAGPRDARELVARLGAPDARVRGHAARRLMLMGPAVAAAPLGELMSSEDAPDEALLEGLFVLASWEGLAAHLPAAAEWGTRPDDDEVTLAAALVVVSRLGRGDDAALARAAHALGGSARVRATGALLCGCWTRSPSECVRTLDRQVSGPVPPPLSTLRIPVPLPGSRLAEEADAGLPAGPSADLRSHVLDAVIRRLARETDGTVVPWLAFAGELAPLEDRAPDFLRSPWPEVRRLGVQGVLDCGVASDADVARVVELALSDTWWQPGEAGDALLRLGERGAALVGRQAVVAGEPEVRSRARAMLRDEPRLVAGALPEILRHATVPRWGRNVPGWLFSAGFLFSRVPPLGPPWVGPDVLRHRAALTAVRAVGGPAWTTVASDLRARPRGSWEARALWAVVAARPELPRDRERRAALRADLLHVARHGSTRARAAAVAALGRELGEDDPEVGRAVAWALRDSSPRVRRAATIATYAIREPALEARDAGVLRRRLLWTVHRAHPGVASAARRWLTLMDRE